MAPTTSSSPPGAPAREVLPRRAPRLLSAVLDGEEVVYDPVRREAHLLNPTASLLLARCDGSTVVADVVAELAGAFDADPAVVGADVAAAIDDFTTRQIVGPEPSPADIAPVARPLPELVPLTEPVVLPERWAVETPTLVALQSRLRVRSDEPIVGRYVEQIFASLIDAQVTSSDQVTSPDQVHGQVHVLDIVTGGDGPIRLLLDGTEVGASNTFGAALSYLQWQINQLAIDEAGDLLLLHASAVRDGDRVAVFPAASNSGKSTLAAGMVRAGLGYVTDEALAIDVATGRVVSYPKPLSLDRGSWALFEAWEPVVDGATEPLFENEWHIDPSLLHPDALEPGALEPGKPGGPSESGGSGPHIALVAFPGYRTGATTELVPMRKAEALLLLLENSFNLAALGEAGLAVLVEIAETARVARFPLSDLDEAVDLIRTAL